MWPNGPDFALRSHRALRPDRTLRTLGTRRTPWPLGTHLALYASRTHGTDAIASVKHTVEIHILLETRQTVTIEIPTRDAIDTTLTIGTR